MSYTQLGNYSLLAVVFEVSFREKAFSSFPWIVNLLQTVFDIFMTDPNAQSSVVMRRDLILSYLSHDLIIKTADLFEHVRVGVECTDLDPEAT